MEALIVNRLGGVRQHAIVPIDECYRLVGLVRVELGGDFRRGRRSKTQSPVSSKELQGRAL